MARYGQIWPDMGRYSQIWPDIARYARYGQIWPDMVRYSQIWPDMARYGQLGPKSLKINLLGLKPSREQNAKSSIKDSRAWVKPSWEPNAKSSNKIGRCGHPQWVGGGKTHISQNPSAGARESAWKRLVVPCGRAGSASAVEIFKMFLHVDHLEN